MIAAIVAAVALLVFTSNCYAADNDEPAGRVESLPEVKVVGHILNEERTVGQNEQPEWTTNRRFSTTRIYVLPPWTAQVDLLWKAEFPRGEGPEHTLQQEFEAGLPWRLQVDVEVAEVREQEEFRYDATNLEIRWALADWGAVFLNPTLMGEWQFKDESPDAYELQLLIGEELASRWHWGMNFFYGHETGGETATEYAFSHALSYTVLDRRLSAGVEMKFEYETDIGEDEDSETRFLIGPSVQWRPMNHIHVDLVPLFGTTDDSPHAETFAIVGVTFGGEMERETSAPLSLEGK